MTTPCLSRVYCHKGVGRVRAVALDSDGQACAVFEQRWNGAGQLAPLGSVQCGHIRAVVPDQGGVFVELQSGEEVFVASKQAGDAREGLHVRLEILSEARRGKSARGKVTTQPVSQSFDPFAGWLARLPGGAGLPISFGRSATIDAAFADLLAPSHTLDRGGQLRIDRTRALIACDIDSSGRQGRGSAGARALSLNKTAAVEAARQMALRDYGGLVVLDCVAPLNQNAGQKIQTAFQSAFRAYSNRPVKTLPPSPFGLLQASIGWGYAPMEDRLCSPSGEKSAETVLLDLVDAAAREAEAEQAAFYEINLCADTFQAYLACKPACNASLLEQFSGRVHINQSHASADGVSRR